MGLGQMLFSFFFLPNHWPVNYSLSSRVNAFPVQYSTVIQSKVLRADLYCWSFWRPNIHQKAMPTDVAPAGRNSVISVFSSCGSQHRIVGVSAHRIVAGISSMGAFVDFHCDSPAKHKRTSYRNLHISWSRCPGYSDVVKIIFPVTQTCSQEL